MTAFKQVLILGTLWLCGTNNLERGVLSGRIGCQFGKEAFLGRFWNPISLSPLPSPTWFHEIFETSFMERKLPRISCSGCLHLPAQTHNFATGILTYGVPDLSSTGVQACILNSWILKGTTVLSCKSPLWNPDALPWHVRAGRALFRQWLYSSLPNLAIRQHVSD